MFTSGHTPPGCWRVRQAPRSGTARWRTGRGACPQSPLCPLARSRSPQECSPRSASLTCSGSAGTSRSLWPTCSSHLCLVSVSLTSARTWQTQGSEREAAGSACTAEVVEVFAEEVHPVPHLRRAEQTQSIRSVALLWSSPLRWWCRPAWKWT